MTKNNYARLQQTYVSDNYPNYNYKNLFSQDKCPKQQRENFGAFSIRAAVRPPYSGCNCQNGCNCNQINVPGVN
jgi:hypothetical protein